MIQGIDVSHHNGAVDWPQVADAGIQFVYIKATQGTGYVDPMFVRNLAGAAAAGIAHGVYHYLSPMAQAADQATHFLTTIDSKVGQLPPVVDVEPTFADGSNIDLWSRIPMDERVEKVVKFCEAVRLGSGVNPMIYASPSFVEEMLGSDPRLGDYDLWIAEYGVSAPRVPKPFADYRCWQHSELGTVAGAGAGVDLDVWNGEL